MSSRIGDGENRVGEIDLAGVPPSRVLTAISCLTLIRWPFGRRTSAGGARPPQQPLGALRRPAGYGASFGDGPLEASLTMT